MRTLPPKMVQVLAPFAPLFSKSVCQHAQLLVAGAILARPGARTVCCALRAMGLDQEKRFHRYHRVLSRASWSSRGVSRLLLGLLIEAFVPEGSPLVVGIDETLERRYGRKISARGVCRDPVRSTHDTFVKSSGHWYERSCGRWKGADFLRVALGGRHDKSPTGICGTTNRCGLLRSLMAKAELWFLVCFVVTCIMAIPPQGRFKANE